MASFRGLAFEAAVGPADDDVVLFAAARPPEGLPFEHDAGQWRAQVRRSELDALWESRPVGRYRGHGCMVLDDLGDRLHIAFTGHDAYHAEQLGYWQVDRGVYEVVVPRHDVSDLADVREDHPPRRPEPAASAGPPAATATGPGTPPPGMMAANPGMVPAGTSGSDTVTRGPLADAAAAAAAFGPMPAVARPSSPPEPAAQETSYPSASGSTAEETSFRGAAGPLAAPAGPTSPDSAAPESTQPQRSTTAEPAGPNGSAAQQARRQEVGRHHAGPQQARPQQARPQQARPQQARPQQARPQDAGEQHGGSPQGGMQDPGPRYAGSPGTGQHAALHDTGPQHAAPQRTTPPETSVPDTPAPAPDAPAQDPRSPDPDTPAPVGRDLVSAGAQRHPGAAAAAGTASADTGQSGGSRPPGSQALPQRSSGPPASLSSAQPSPAPGSAPASGDRPAAAPSPASRRSAFSLPADMMAPAPPREPPANGPSRWHPWSTAAGPSGTAGQQDAAGAAPSPEAGSQARQAGVHSVFRDLVGVADIPDRAYAIDEDVDGARCLVRTDDGFEVYRSTGNEKHEVRFFLDEESAYFYLFGVLAADSLRSGRLIRREG